MPLCARRSTGDPKPRCTGGDAPGLAEAAFAEERDTVYKHDASPRRLSRAAPHCII